MTNTILCDRCQNPADFDNGGGCCEECGDNLCTKCARWAEGICAACQSTEEQGIEGWILIHDFTDPVRSTYKLFKSIADALDDAKIVLQTVLCSKHDIPSLQPDATEKIEATQEYRELKSQLEEAYEVFIDDAHGWASENVLIRIAPVFKQQENSM